MDLKPMEPYGLALLDYFNGNHSATTVVHRDDGQDVGLPASVFFRGVAEFSAIEREAIDLCFGKVLDIGAGTGRHSLILQSRGLKVVGLDIASQAVEIMKKNGVEDVECADIFNFRRGKYDTLLLLLHGIGMVGDIAGLDRFLDHAHTLISQRGILLFDSLDVRCSDDPANLAYQERNRMQGRYRGEIRFQFEYKSLRGPTVHWLQVDPDTLKDRAQTSGWSSTVVLREPMGDYLAKLSEL